MNLDEVLARSARVVAANLPVPRAPDPQLLGERTQSLRRRRLMGAAAMAAVAVLVGVVVVPVLTADRSDPPAQDPPPDRLGTVTAWVDAQGNLHVGEERIDVGEGSRFALTARGVVWSGTAGRSRLYWQSLDGEPVELTTEPWLFFTSDPLGDHVAWVTRASEVVVYDVAQHREVRRQRVSEFGSGGVDYPMTPVAESLVLHVDDDRVVYEAGGSTWTLDISTGSVTRLSGVSASDLLDHGPLGSVVAVSSVRDRSTGADSLGQLEFRGQAGTVRAKSPRLFREGRLSATGRWFVTSTGYEAGLRAVVLDTLTGKLVPLDIPDRPRGAYYGPWGWSGDVLMLGLYRKADGDGGRVEEVWACRPPDAPCERLPDALPIYPW